MDYQALLYDPIYNALGVSAQLDLGTDGIVPLTVIDKTAGIAVGDGVEVHTIKPACDARMVELLSVGVSFDELENAPITFNGKTWTVTHHELRPSPRGENDGELRMFLSQ